MKQLSIVLPTYNEKANVKLLIPELERKFKDYDFEIVVVDDKSPDGTAEECRKLNAKYKNIRVINKAKKEGIGAALRLGYNNARGAIILSSDSDLSFKVDDLFKILKKLNRGYDVVVGSRHTKKGRYESERFIIKVKHFVSKSGNAFMNFLFSINITDFSANFRGIKRDAWKKMKCTDNTNSMLLEMIVKARISGFKVSEVPVSFVDRRFGKSKLKLWREIPKFIFKALYYYILLLKAKFKS